MNPGAQRPDDYQVDEPGNHQGGTWLDVASLDHHEMHNAFEPASTLRLPNLDVLRQSENHAPKTVGIEPKTTKDNSR
jgi:hypothetical protein